MQTRRKGENNAELNLSPRLCVEPLITAITATLDMRYISTPTWPRGFRVKIEILLSFFRLSIPKRDLVYWPRLFEAD